MNFSYYKSIAQEPLGKIEGANRQFTLDDAISFENATNWFSRKFKQIVFRYQGKGKFSEDNLNKVFNKIEEKNLSILVQKCHSLLEDNLSQSPQTKNTDSLADLVPEYIDENEIKKFKHYQKKNKHGLEKVIELFDSQIANKHNEIRKHHEERVTQVREFIFDNKNAQLQRQANKKGEEIEVKKFTDLSSNEVKELKLPYVQEIRKGKIEFTLKHLQNKLPSESQGVQATQNPVTKMEPEFYFSLTEIEERLKNVTWEEVESILKKYELSTSLKNEVKKEFEKGANNNIEILRILEESMEQEPYEALKRELESFKPVDFSKIQKYVKKDEVLTALQIQENYEIPEERWGEYIPLEEVDNLSVKNLNVYVKLSDIVFADKDNPSLKDRLTALKEKQEVYRFAEDTYAFKTGIENRNEIRGYKILRLLGLDRYYVPKAEVNLTRTVAGHKSKQGIAGTWIRSTESQAAALYWYQETERKYEIAKSKDEDVSKISKELQERSEALKSVGSSENIIEHCLADAILGSVDSHFSQYAIDADTKEYYCFDFARFLLPGMIYTIDNRSYGMIRSAFLDHPAALEPLPEKIVQRFREIDLEELESSMREERLIGSQEFFDQKVFEMSELKKDLPVGSVDEEETQRAIVQGCDKYQVEMEGKSFVALKQELEDEIRSRIENIQQECFQKTHPKAVALMIKRLELLKEYLSSGKIPYTAQGAFAAMNPLLQPFVEVFSRLQRNPHNLFYNENYSLEHIMTWAEKGDGSILVSEKERAVMRNALLELKKPENCCSYEEVQTAIGFK